LIYWQKYIKYSCAAMQHHIHIDRKENDSISC
jgi:hypothetical protein